MPPRTAYVLGAGFTKSFAPAAPLLIDDYCDDALKEKFGRLEHANEILQRELRDYDGKVNLERLMTRLEGGMPYDWRTGAHAELALLLAEVKERFKSRLDKAKIDHEEDLKRFATHCRRNHIDCITFNYDDFLDKAICDYGAPDAEWWDPNWGYGFFCESAAAASGLWDPEPRRCAGGDRLLRLRMPVCTRSLSLMCES
jgi:hypothetical protein